MRRLSLLLVMALGASAAANPSNPAFLGISFSPNGSAGIGAVVGGVTIDSPAERAGLQPMDVIMAIDGQMIDATTLNTQITGHQPGDTIRLDIVRNGTQYVTLTPTLTTRAGMFDRLLGHPLTQVGLTDSETGQAIDIGKPSGHATVIAWYHGDSGGGACIDPVPVVQDVARRVSSIKNSSAVVLAATYGGPETDGVANPANPVTAAIAVDRKRLGLQVGITNKSGFSRVAIDECGRVFAMVLDCRGVVTFLTPISDGDDEDAALDELATAAAQADHKRR